MELSRSRSRTSVRGEVQTYEGGGGLGLTQSARSRRVVGKPDVREPGIEEGAEGEEVDLEEARNKVEEDRVEMERLEVLYARFTPRQKGFILFLVSFAALLAP